MGSGSARANGKNEHDKNDEDQRAIQNEVATSSVPCKKRIFRRADSDLTCLVNWESTIRATLGLVGHFLAALLARNQGHVCTSSWLGQPLFSAASTPFGP